MISLSIHNSNDVYNVNPTKIICLGMNYGDHVRESATLNVKGADPNIPTEPILFAKTPNVLIGPNENIVIPKLLKEYKFEKARTDYEAELAFIIKDRCKNVSKKEAFQHILGFTCFNDVSERNVQSMEKAGWFRGKSFDTYGSIGPMVVLTKDIGDAQNLNIYCRLNSQTVQNSNTKFMIFPLPEIVEFISKNFTLEPGDIISTGTPAGVGPMKHGDIVEVEIEGIGILKNNVIEE